MYEKYRKQGYWSDVTTSDLWERNARDYPDKEALVDSRTRLTWREANEWIDRLALGFLELGIGKDQLVVVQLPNCVELCLLRVACERAGTLCLPVLRTWRHNEMIHSLGRTEATAVVIPWKFRNFDHYEMIRELRPQLPTLKHVLVLGDEVPEGTISLQELLRRPPGGTHTRASLEEVRTRAEEFSLVLPTTGTTGLPKFVENPICSFMCRELACVEDLGITCEDILIALSPTAGGSNGRVYLGAPLAVAKIVMLEHFSPLEALETIEKERVTFAPMVPAQLSMIVEHPDFDKYDISSLRAVMTMGAPLPFEVALAVEKKLGCPIVQNYSAIDCSAACKGSLDEPPEVRFRTVGRPYAAAEVRLVDEAGTDVAPGESGEVLLRGPAAVSGYFKDPETTWQVWTKDGWYKTGDLGKLDEAGRLMIVGRKKEMILRGGQNVYPVEIEHLLINHPHVANVAIVKMPDPVMGEKACAYVVPAHGRHFTFEEMVSFLKEKSIAPYKLPERLEIIDALPMVAEGQKIDKKALEKDVVEKLKAEGKI
jgi:non-ribosomal peptide synthetase component E (peptide arylation enzyme)